MLETYKVHVSHPTQGFDGFIDTAVIDHDNKTAKVYFGKPDGSQEKNPTVMTMQEFIKRCDINNDKKADPAMFAPCPRHSHPNQTLAFSLSKANYTNLIDNTEKVGVFGRGATQDFNDDGRPDEAYTSEVDGTHYHYIHLQPTI